VSFPVSVRGSGIAPITIVGTRVGLGAWRSVTARTFLLGA